MNEIINYKLHNLKRIRSVTKWDNFNYLKKLSAERLHERLFEIKRNFNLGLDIGCHSGEFGTLINNKKKIKKLIQGDTIFQFCKNSNKTSICSNSLTSTNSGISSGSSIGKNPNISPDCKLSSNRTKI